MKIKNGTIASESADEIFDYYNSEFQKKYGSDFSVKKGGLLDSLLNVIIQTELDIQSAIIELSKLFSPDNVELNLQDAMFERIGVHRLGAGAAGFKKEILSDTVIKVEAKQILIRSKSDGSEFYNSDNFITNSSGITPVYFKSVENKKSNISEDEEFNIVYAPVGILTLSDKPAENIVSGADRELDEDYKKRYNNSKSLNSSATYSANFSNLSIYTGPNLKIIDRNINRLYSAGTVEIIAKHNTTDKIFASAIADTFGLGISYIGNTEEELTDLKGNHFKVRFSNASDVTIDLSLNIKISENYDSQSVINTVKNSIVNYASAKYKLGDLIYANEFAIPVMMVEGVISADNLLIKKSDMELFQDKLVLSDYEYPNFDVLNITISEEVSSEDN